MYNLHTEISYSDIEEYIKEKHVLVTGGAGSIGSALVHRLCSMDVKFVRILDIDESRLAMLKRKFSHCNIELFLCDIRDYSCVKSAIVDIDIVFHAAALKHVPLSELFPYEYVKTNVIGTQNLIDASMDSSVEKFVLISTDKAVNPINVMGATKLLAERLTIAANLAAMNKGTKFSCVRFGNVLYTRGSVIEIFMDQLKHGGPITVTDPNMTRFIISVNKAVDLILKAVCFMRGGEIFILKMNAVKIIDLARAFIEVFAKKFGYDPQRIEIKIIGRRPGEKLHEELMTEYEASRAIELPDMFVILPEILKLGCIEQYNVLNKNKVKVQRYSSNNVKLLDINSVKKLLEEFYKYFEGVMF